MTCVLCQAWFVRATACVPGTLCDCGECLGAREARQLTAYQLAAAKTRAAQRDRDR